MSITFKHEGGFKNFENFANKVSRQDYLKIIKRYAQEAVILLQKATPVDTGKTADSWAYEIHKTNKYVEVLFTNSNVTKDGVPIALLIQTGHVTGTGAYVQGIDYINPALKKSFDDIAKSLWKELTS